MSEQAMSNAAGEMAVEVKGIGVTFGHNRVLDDITFSLPTGAFLTVLGPNGSGKSTLLKVLLGLVKPDRGAVRMHSTSLDRTLPHWLGYVPQLKTLDRRFPGASIELVASGLRRAWPWRISKTEREKSMDALRRVEAGHIAEYPIARLSGGELQRVYLARAVVQDPRFVALDEPATGIDMVGEESLYRVLDALHQSGRVTIVMVTHDLNVAFHHATHALLLNHRMVGFGPPETALVEENLQVAFGHMGHRLTLPYREDVSE